MGRSHHPLNPNAMIGAAGGEVHRGGGVLRRVVYRALGRRRTGLGGGPLGGLGAGAGAGSGLGGLGAGAGSGLGAGAGSGLGAGAGAGLGAGLGADVVGTVAGGVAAAALAAAESAQPVPPGADVPDPSGPNTPPAGGQAAGAPPEMRDA